MLLSPSYAILFCGNCGSATVETERGWRAYRAVGHGGRPLVAVLCPRCSEWLYGEDEAEDECE